MWSAAHFRRLGLIGGSLVLAVGAWVLWTSADPHGMPAAVAGILAVLLTVGGGVCSRSYKDHIGGAVLGGCAVPYAFLAGLGRAAASSQTAGLGRSHFLVACAAVLVVAVIGGVVQEEHDEVYLAAGIAGDDRRAGRGGRPGRRTPTRSSSRPGPAPWPIAAIGFLPGLAMRLVRFPMPELIDGAPQVGPGGQQQRATLPPGNDEPVDTEAIGRRTRRGHELLTGLVAACALVTVVWRVRCSRSPRCTAAAAPGRMAWPASSAWCSSPGPGCCGAPRRSAALIGGGVIAETMRCWSARPCSCPRRPSRPGTSPWCWPVGLLLLLVGFALPGRALSPRWARTRRPARRAAAGLGHPGAAGRARRLQHGAVGRSLTARPRSIAAHGGPSDLTVRAGPVALVDCRRGFETAA